MNKECHEKELSAVKEVFVEKGGLIKKCLLRKGHPDKILLMIIAYTRSEAHNCPGNA